MPPEPRITINGHALTEAQAATVRVALACLHVDVIDPELKNMIGTIGDHYKDRLREIYRMMA